MSKYKEELFTKKSTAMKKDMKKIGIMLGLVLGFTTMALAQIWVPWTMWVLQEKNPCEHGLFIDDGGRTFIEGEPAVSGHCICDPGYEGPLCQFEKLK